MFTAIGLTSGGSSTVHIYTQTIHRTTQSTQTINRTTQLTKWEECEPCPAFASHTIEFVLQLRKKHGKTSVRVAEECYTIRTFPEMYNKGQAVAVLHLAGNTGKKDH
jgi:NMD protein affecting ribosome stability and mRNA decay